MDKCKATMQIRGMTFNCDLPAGHKGRHASASDIMYPTPRCDMFVMYWGNKEDGLEIESNPEPKLTEFEKARNQFRDSWDVYHMAWQDVFLCGWEAKERTIKKIISLT